jgi:hypothetical protein
MHTAASDIQQFVGSTLSKADKGRVDFVYLSKRVNILLDEASYYPNSSVFLDWHLVVELGGLLFGSETFTVKQPEWLQAGALFTELCIQQCKGAKVTSGNILREGLIYAPTRPYKYLSFASACFNSGLCKPGSSSKFDIPQKDWMACRTDFEVCQKLAEKMKLAVIN